MLDGVSLDQPRTFSAAADEGSFPAAGRRLRRAQSAVSQTLANLEGQLGVKVFDRSGRFPVLTDQGRALLADARAMQTGQCTLEDILFSLKWTEDNYLRAFITAPSPATVP
jgi:DNA-binding transcriptional LysR family regulator